MIQIDMKIPECCDQCFALDDTGDYPYCMISHDSRGYTFPIFEKRMESCPLKEQAITHEQAIDYLISTGWLQKHDRIISQPVEATPLAKDKHHWYCGRCGCRIRWKIKPRFCHKCGAKIRRVLP